MQNSSELLHTLQTYEHYYTEKDLEIFRGLLWTHIELSKQEILLPMVNVGTQEEPIGISYYDPDYVRNPVVATVSRAALRVHFEYFNAGVVLKTDSIKSDWSIGGAASDVGAEVINIPSGLSEDDVKSRSEVGSVRRYKPITLLGQNIDKFMGKPKGLRNLIKNRLKRGGKVVIGDDVGSLFGTLDTIEGILNEEFPEGLEHYVAFVAREGEAGPNFPPPLRPRMRATIAIAELRGLDASKMTPIKPREGIPKAFII